MSIKLYNTLSRKKENFVPINKNKAGLYVCGPTVYHFAHIGNLRSYLTWDILRRLLEFQGYKVKHVMNITDVGHLTDDGNDGEDKMEKGAIRENKSAHEIADFYTQAFMDNLKDLNILSPHIACKATEHIKEQIKLIKKLEKKGFTYETPDGIYFDTSRLSGYGKLACLKKDQLLGGIRVAVGGKRNPTDFALWKFSPKLKKRQMEWDSPWGIGFPGWHIECSAMSQKYLGLPFDIHTGGIDHIPVHHTNEIAQLEAAEGVAPVSYWLHNEFLTLGDEKMAKSAGGFITLETLKENKINPLSYRYFILQTHYRKQLKFSYEALHSAENGLMHLYELVKKSTDKNIDDTKIIDNILSALNNDLDTPKALAILWQTIKKNKINKKTILKLDKLFGLQIKENIHTKELKIPKEISLLINARDTARINKNWSESDRLRNQLIDLGYEVTDTTKGTEVKLTK